MQHRIVQERKRPRWLVIMMIGTASILFLGIGLGVFFYRHQLTELGYQAMGRPVTAFARMQAQNQRLKSKVKDLQDELLELRGKQTFDERSRSIDVQACDALKESVTGLESELAQCREQLVFYRGIVSPEQNRAGVHVLRVDVQKAQEGLWHYDLVMVQPTRRNHTAKGRFLISVEGILDKQMKTLDLSELQPSIGKRNRFEFRSFQEFEGVLNFPPGFLPAKLSVTLEVDGRRGKPTKVTESYDWAQLVNQSKEK